MVDAAKTNKEEVRLVCTNSMYDPSYLTNPILSRRQIFEIIAALSPRPGKPDKYVETFHPHQKRKRISEVAGG